MNSISLYRTLFVVLGLGTCVCFGGCSGDASTGDAEAIVTVDGKPLAEGSVRFIPLDGKSPTAGGRIRGGKLSVAGVPVGKHRVEIEARIVKPGTPATATVDEVQTVELVPPRYNTNSELTWEISPGLNEKTWDLKGR